MPTDLTTNAGQLLAAATAVLGPVEVVSDHSWPHGESRVLEVEDGDGGLWIAKAVRAQVPYQREVRAMLEWTPALGESAPALAWHDDQSRLLIMRRLPGRPVDGTRAETDPAVHTCAGRLIRLLHDAAPAEQETGLGDLLAAKLERWITQGRDLVAPDEAEFARQEVRKLAGAGPLQTVPCHLDNHPRNWLIDDAGSVRLIDFGQSRPDVWIHDMERLYAGVWSGRPDLRDAYFEGYGRRPGEQDLLVLRAYSAYAALSTIVWGHEHDDAEFSRHGRQTLRRMQEDELAEG